MHVALAGAAEVAVADAVGPAACKLSFPFSSPSSSSQSLSSPEPPEGVLACEVVCEAEASDVVDTGPFALPEVVGAAEPSAELEASLTVDVESGAVPVAVPVTEGALLTPVADADADPDVADGSAPPAARAFLTFWRKFGSSVFSGEAIVSHMHA